MGSTSFLGLTTTTSGDGSSVNFLTWRLAINGTDSNMAQIDTFAAGVGSMSSGSISRIYSWLSGSGVTNGNSHNHVGGDGGTISHGALSNLTAPADDHTQYLKVAGGRAASGSIVGEQGIYLSGGGLTVGNYGAGVSGSSQSGTLNSYYDAFIGRGLVIGAGTVISASTAASGELRFLQQSSRPSATTSSIKLMNVSGCVVEVSSSGSGTVIGWGAIKRLRGWVSSPGTVYDSRPQIILLKTENPIQIFHAHISPSTSSGSITGDLKYNDNTHTFTGATTVGAVDATSGSVTVTSFSTPVVPANKYLYYNMDFAATGLDDFYIEVFYNYV